MVPWWSLLIALAAGGFITSFVEYKLKYNLTDEEFDLLKSLYAKATAAEQNVMAKVAHLLRKAEFWKKA